jgi:hypothetical protein
MHGELDMRTTTQHGHALFTKHDPYVTGISGFGSDHQMYSSSAQFGLYKAYDICDQLSMSPCLATMTNGKSQPLFLKESHTYGKRRERYIIRFVKPLQKINSKNCMDNKGSEVYIEPMLVKPSLDRKIILSLERLEWCCRIMNGSPVISKMSGDIFIGL